MGIGKKCLGMIECKIEVPKQECESSAHSSLSLLCQMVYAVIVKVNDVADTPSV